jgi:hypothetical protein
MGAHQKGDRVTWSSGPRRAEGTVERVITRRAKVGGRTVAGSRSNPRYVVRDEETGKRSVRTAAALRAPEPQRRGLPPWQAIAGASAAATFAVAGAIYFTQAPGRLADDYRDRAAPAFERVDDSVYEAHQAFRADYFRGLAVEGFNKKRLGDDIGDLRRLVRRQYASDRDHISAARRAIAEAERTLDENEAAMSDVDAWPLLDGVGDLSDADDSAGDADAYAADVRDYLARFRELTDFAERTLELDEVLSDALLDDAEATGSSSFETAKAGIDRTLRRLQSARSKIEALETPSGEGEAFLFGARRGAAILVEFYGEVQGAYENLSPGQLDSAVAAFDEDLKRFGRRVIIGFGELQSDSAISDAIDALDESEKELAEGLGADEGPGSEPAPYVRPEKTGDSKV